MNTLRSTDDALALLKDVALKADSGALPLGYGVFARTYHRMTLEMIVALADGTFDDAPRVAAFIASFADKYRRALEGPPALPWARAFDVATREPIEPLAALITGVNAHMAYDLVITLVDDHGTDANTRADYDKINAVLARAIGPVQNILAERYGRWLRTLDALSFNLDEILSLAIFTAIRDRAWSDAVDIDAGRLTREQVAERVAGLPIG